MTRPQPLVARRVAVPKLKGGPVPAGVVVRPTIADCIDAAVRAFGVSPTDLLGSRKLVPLRRRLILLCRNFGHGPAAIGRAFNRDPRGIRRLIRPRNPRSSQVKHGYVGDNSFSLLRARNSEAYRLVDERS